MSDTLESIVHLLSCPDDGSCLRRTGDGLHCHECGRQFPMVAENFVELLPIRPASLTLSSNEEYRRTYLQLFSELIGEDSTAMAWGAEESGPRSWIRKRQRQVQAVLFLVTAGADPSRSVLCDFAAGAGYYTFTYAPYFRCVLHCDLSLANLNYCRQRARSRNVSNIMFVRMDYFSPPFRNSLERLICFDTIIRGEEHDRLLLHNLVRSMRPDGKAIIDFHNWWHNPFRRAGLLKENFASNKSYSRQSAESLLANVGIDRFAYRPFHQEFDAKGVFGTTCAHLLPPTRLIYSFEGHN
jgi:SAM-dependent methyltransferase